MKLLWGLIIALAALGLAVATSNNLQLRSLSSSLRSGSSKVELQAAMVTIHKDYKCSDGSTHTATATYNPATTTPETAGEWLDAAIKYLTTTC